MPICDPQGQLLSIPLYAGTTTFRSPPRTLCYPKLSSDKYRVTMPLFAMPDGESQGVSIIIIRFNLSLSVTRIRVRSSVIPMLHCNDPHYCTSARNKTISESARIMSACQRWRRHQNDRHSLNSIQKLRPTLQAPKSTMPGDTETTDNEVHLLHMHLTRFKL